MALIDINKLKQDAHAAAQIAASGASQEVFSAMLSQLGFIG